ncbi:MAG: HAMP domain-containing histidine kinase [Flavobacteriales bacterium]|nr:HAMP domain-containing histidine kinase [Flavobacteriales bacterium]
MSRSTIRIIIVLATVLFIGLVSTQIFWVKKAYEITQRQLEHEIELALIDVVKDIQRHSGDSTFLVDPVKLVSPHFFRVQINEELQPFYLESMLMTEFLNRELNFQFQYSIYNCFNDSVVFTQSVSSEMEEIQPNASEVPPPIDWEDDGHYFAVYFPSLNIEVFSEMRFWVVSSIVLLAVLIFFTYVISVILRQKRLSEIKNDFINNMTHELKTPISTISLSSDVLLQKGIELQPERLRNYARIIKNENQRLQTQVERVLQIARLDKEEMDLTKQQVDLHQLVALAVPTIEMNFQEKGIVIDTVLNAQKATLYGDEMHITNILFNLLDNAAKYGGDQPNIRLETNSDDKGVYVSIIDDGPGIPQDQQKFIFEKFYRIPTGNVHDVKGFGLGLHYVRTIAEAHGGKIKLRSKPNEGSTFEVFLPFGTEVVKN